MNVRERAAELACELYGPGARLVSDKIVNEVRQEILQELLSTWSTSLSYGKVDRAENIRDAIKVVRNVCR